jgi:hypothetical protein
LGKTTNRGGHLEALIVEDGVSGILEVANANHVVLAAESLHGALKGAEGSLSQQKNVGSGVNNNITEGASMDADRLVANGNVGHSDSVQSSSVTSKGSVLELASVEGRISTTDGHDATSAGRVEAKSKLVLDLTGLNKSLKGGRVAVLGLASEANNTINNEELLEVGRLGENGSSERKNETKCEIGSAVAKT